MTYVSRRTAKPRQRDFKTTFVYCATDLQLSWSSAPGLEFGESSVGVP